MDKLKMHSPDLTQANIAKVRELFPGCVTEAANVDGSIRLTVDFDQLRQELSYNLVEGLQERYQLNWPGKAASLALSNAPTAKTLRPMIADSVNFDATCNIYIEGDNLDALKLLRETYLGSIKMIYIDPPYNTGNDFLYNDDFAETSEEYLKRSLQKDDEGNRLTVNKETNGKFHSDWLSRINARLRVARHLLTDDGLIFISIDDELANLKKLCDEVFGASNFIDIFSWQKTTTPPNLSKKTKKTCEYILCYQKRESGPLVGLRKDSVSSNGLMNQTNSVGTLTFPAHQTTTKLKDGAYKAGRYGTKSYEIDLLSDTEVNDGVFVAPVVLRGKFKWSQPYLNKALEDGVKLAIQTIAFSPSYEKAEYDPEKPWNLLNKASGVGTNENASDELDQLFSQNFSERLYPKPVSLLKYLIRTNMGDGDTLLDFYSGSATSAHALLEVNAEDGLQRRFIMVQLDEPVDENSFAAKSGFKTISDIGRERIRRAGKKILATKVNDSWDRDVGFRALRIDTSNMADVFYTPDVTNQGDLLAQVDSIKQDRTAEDLLFQVLVDWGVDLTLPIRRENVHGKTVFFVDENALIACFDTGVTEELVKELAGHEPVRVVFRDTGFVSDAVKINVEQIFHQLSPSTEVKAI
jgi:adenine-specific DNA-methyltransferase